MPVRWVGDQSSFLQVKVGKEVSKLFVTHKWYTIHTKTYDHRTQMSLFSQYPRREFLKCQITTSFYDLTINLIALVMDFECESFFIL